MLASASCNCRWILFVLCGLVSSAHADVTLIGTHPDARLQSTDTGRTLHTLEAVGKNLFVGYGDYGADTGPISIRAFDTNAESFSDSFGIGNTDAIFQIRNVGDQVYALSTDPLLQGPGGYLSGTAGSPWETMESLAGVHFYGITDYQSDSQHLFLAGSGGPTARSNAMVYESVDGGANWTTSLDLAKPDDLVGVNFLRIYGIAELNNSLYVQPMGLGTTKAALELHVYDGTSWQTQPTPATADGKTTEFFDAETFDENLILRNNHSGFRLSPTFIFDGVNLEEVDIAGANGKLSFWDQYTTDDALYLLTSDSTVVATTDLNNWRIVASEIPNTARSLAVIGDHLYLGTSDSTLYQTQIVSVPEPSAGCFMLLALCLVCIARRTNPS